MTPATPSAFLATNLTKNMIGRVVLAVILSGIAAGLVMGLIQHVRLTPLILEAETFEHVAHGHGAEAHSHGDHVWSPANGLERTFYTTVTAIISAVGFGLLMIGLAFTFKIPFNRSNAWIWGLCGFFAVSFAPAIGLPPELPGMPSAELNSRLFWWGGSVVMTALGLASLYYVYIGKKAWSPAVTFLLWPHIFPAPQATAGTESTVPAHLATQFVTSSLGANLVMWVILSIVLGLALQKFESTINS
jgi:cobalt transporter subunit CbtA